MIKIVSFYKDIDLNYEKTKKLRQRLSFDYKDCQQKLMTTLEKFNRDNCEFIVSTDNRTILKNYLRIERNNLDNKLLMESVVIANNNFIQKEHGQILLLGADHLFCGNPSVLFEDQFDLGFLIVDIFDSTHRTNINNTIVIVNSNSNNLKNIRKFFKDRMEMFKTLPSEDQNWFGDQKSISLLLEQQNIITAYHKTKKEFYMFDDLKIKLIPWGKKYLKIVDENGNYKKESTDVLIDFCGKDHIKKHMTTVYQNLINGN
jgi:hypothetical protein